MNKDKAIQLLIRELTAMKQLPIRYDEYRRYALGFTDALYHCGFSFADDVMETAREWMEQNSIPCAQ